LDARSWIEHFNFELKDTILYVTYLPSFFANQLIQVQND
jgi:hypothetical protein